MRVKKPKVKKRLSAGGKLYRLAVIVFAVYSGVSIIQLQADVQQRKQELDELMVKCDAQRIENKELELQLGRGDDEDYIIRTARERLNFVYPYETVYINVSGS